MNELPSEMSKACAGLRLKPRALPSSLLWDATGIALFQNVKNLEGYFQARVEKHILENLSENIANRFAGKITLVEYGASSIDKALLLLGAIKPENYVLVDLCAGPLASIEETLDEKIPGRKFKVFLTVQDFQLPLTLPEETREQTRVGLCAGQTLGNFEPNEFKQCLLEMRNTLGEKSSLLIGMDIVTDGGTLLNAYSDRHGVTENFVLNVLTRLNREGNGNFNIKNFTYQPIWEEEKSRIGIHLISKVKQTVWFCEEQFDFDANEKIHLVNSYKYSIDEFKRRIKKTGLEYIFSCTDNENRCAIYLLQAQSDVPT